MMRYLKLSFEELKVPVKVYDIEEKRIIGSFESQTEASEWLGIEQGMVRSAQYRRGRTFSKRHGKKVAIR